MVRSFYSTLDVGHYDRSYMYAMATYHCAYRISRSRKYTVYTVSGWQRTYMYRIQEVALALALF